MDLIAIVVGLHLFVFGICVEGQGLSYNFYENSCPQVEAIVRAAIQPIFLTDPTSPAAFLRLMFHDCQVQVSCADILVLAAREAVVVSGGPQIKVALGRRDSPFAPSYKHADSLLPSATTGVDGMLQLFANKEMTVEESVAIMGAHTLGVTHCLNILNRLNQADEGGQVQGMAPGFESFLRLNCPQGSLASNASFVLNDPTTLTFDNHYYKNVIRGHGVLRVDTEMIMDPRTAMAVKRFAANQDDFFQAFSSAFVKLSNSGVLTGNQGVVRKNCNALD
ncbi:peroxidase 29 isoform X2 [Malus domestica]|uniref:peroxidase 29 isoform X2 n=1 Tax=Malus domestica TaxID=3750 RepID=UPI003975B860